MITLKHIAMSIEYQYGIFDKTEGSRTKLFISLIDYNQINYSRLFEKAHTNPMKGLRLDLALTGLNKEVLEPYKFDKDGIRALEKLSEDLFEKEYDFEFHKTKFSDLSIAEKKVVCNIDVNDVFFSWKINKESYDILSNFIYLHPEYPLETSNE